jgi:hypothetical protein
MSTEGLTYSQYVYSINNQNARDLFIKLEESVRTGEVTPVEFASKVEELTGKTVSIHRSGSGNVLGYTLNNTSTVSTTNAMNSNVSTIARGNVSMPVSTGIDSITGKATATRLAGVGTKIATGAALVGTAAMCVSAGIALGKTVDSALYNANPDFWNNIGLSSLNPETWRNITAGDDSLGASLLNVLFGFDNDGNGQAYMDANALAYMAYCMNEAGVFNSASGYIAPSDTSPMKNDISYFPQPLAVGGNTAYFSTGETVSFTSTSSSTQFIGFTSPRSDNQTQASITAVDIVPFSITSSEGNTYNSVAVSGGGYTYYVVTNIYFSNRYYSVTTNNTNTITDSMQIIMFIPTKGNEGFDLAYIIFNGTQQQAIEGIGNQEGATLPNFEGLSESEYLPYLQQTYPNLFNNAINYPVIQDDGTVKNYTYVPVPMPNFNNRTDTQPTTGDSTQTNTEINPITLPQELIDAITKVITNPYPKTDTDINTSNPPQNPTDIGDGSSPVGVVPTGSASSLWKIYHPTQSEVNSFGGWLWSSNFIDQILKIFNNPMEAVIGLHKVYATPIDAGTTTIRVGYLDSGVSSAYIEQQYVTVSCGSVNLNEQFGNVFDYSPHTDVQLYLPFVGIVPLNVNDVMRSKISVNYGVDVITGACLAMVEVSRDGNNSVLYQYSGNCAVQYPISSGSYMGIVSSIISVAGGVAATVASGGAAAPLALGAAGGLLNAHTNVQHSGGFSGNSGAMGGKKPYLIITRPITNVAEYDETMNGYPANSYITVGECSGYVKANNAHVINVPASSEELEEIYNYLVSGIIV